MKTQTSVVWSKTQQELKNFVYRRVKNKALAEDIVQDVLVKAYLRLTQLKDTEKVTGWIYQIARNTITDHYRSQSKSIHSSDLDWESDRSSLNDCVSSCLNEMLLTLPEKYREAIELTELANVSQTRLAERLNISYSGAKSRVQRARQMLKDKMVEQYNIKLDAYGNVIVCITVFPAIVMKILLVNENRKAGLPPSYNSLAASCHATAAATIAIATASRIKLIFHKM